MPLKKGLGSTECDVPKEAPAPKKGRNDGINAVLRKGKAINAVMKARQDEAKLLDEQLLLDGSCSMTLGQLIQAEGLTLAEGLEVMERLRAEALGHDEGEKADKKKEQKKEKAKAAAKVKAAAASAAKKVKTPKEGAAPEHVEEEDEGKGKKRKRSPRPKPRPKTSRAKSSSSSSSSKSIRRSKRKRRRMPQHQNPAAKKLSEASLRQL